MIQLKTDADDLMREKMLFSTIERLDLPRDQVNFADVCKSDELAFGKSGTARRQDLQSRWGNVKRSNIRSYVNFLLRLRVSPSRTTKLELDAFNIPSPVSTVASKAKSSAGTKKAKPDDDVLMLSFESLSINDKKTSTHTSSSLFPPPQKMIPPAQQTPVPHSIQNTTGSFSPPHKEATTHGSFGGSPTPSLDNSSMSSGWTECTVAGTVQNPVQSVLDVFDGHPEMCAPFMINRPGSKDDPTGRREHKAILIQREVLPCDLPHYQMWLQEAPDGSQFLLTKEPSISGTFHRVAEMYAKNPASDQAKIAYETKRKIDADPSRHYRFRRMLVRGCKLDNTVFSEGKVGLVKMDVRLVPFTANGFDIKSTIVEWTIALQGNALEKLSTPEDLFSSYQAMWKAGA